MKVSLRYTPQAIEDMAEIKQYISEELENPSAAESTVSMIFKQIDNLRGFPDIGPFLKDRIGMITEYRFLIYGSYLVFYIHEKDIVSVYRVLYKKMDYLSILFD